jgi:hypothetical protein
MHINKHIVRETQKQQARRKREKWSMNEGQHASRFNIYSVCNMHMNGENEINGIRARLDSHTSVMNMHYLHSEYCLMGIASRH